MKSMWEKENPKPSLKCFEIKTHSYFFYIMAKNKEEATTYLSSFDLKENKQNLLLNDNFEEEKKTINQTKWINDERILNAKQYYVGESGDEEDEDSWYSLNDFIKMEENEWKEKSFIWEKKTTPFILTFVEKGT